MNTARAGSGVDQERSTASTTDAEEGSTALLVGGPFDGHRVTPAEMWQTMGIEKQYFIPLSDWQESAVYVPTASGVLTYLHTISDE